MPPGDYVLTVSRGAGAGEHASLEVALHGGAAAGGSTPATRAGAGPAPAPAVRTNGADGPALAAGPDAVAARVGDRVITVAEVDREWRRQDPGGFVALARENPRHPLALHRHAGGRGAHRPTRRMRRA